MTYAAFILLFLVFPTAALVGASLLVRQRGQIDRVNFIHHWRGVAILAVIAFIWTAPWDNFLIASGVWDSPSDRIIGRVFYVPIEEYAFFILMPLFNGAIVYLLLGRSPETAVTWRLPQMRMRMGAALLAGLLFCGGLYALRFDGGTYLGRILVWFSPPLLIQWLFDPGALLRGKRIVIMGTLLPLAYFGLADSYAIREGIWVISEAHTTGLGFPQLPVEELLFFAVTSLLLAQGIVLWHGIKPPSSTA
jgi:lycopene cyclase domain-containing protein